MKTMTSLLLPLIVINSCHSKNDTKLLKPTVQAVQEKESCYCIDDTKDSKTILATNLTVTHKQDGDYLQFNCVSMKRLYKSNEHGQQTEAFDLDCISKTLLQYKLAEDFEYFNATSCEEKITRQQNQGAFFNIIKKERENIFYQLDLGDARAIKEISDFYYQPPADEIIQIETKNYGGKQGYSLSIIVNKDSIYYQQTVAAQNKLEKMQWANTANSWDEITHSFMLPDFKKIKSGKSMQPIDGADHEIIIITKGEKYSIINGQADSNYNRLSGLLQLLESYALRR